jgi:hypothetical protein
MTRLLSPSLMFLGFHLVLIVVALAIIAAN